MKPPFKQVYLTATLTASLRKYHDSLAVHLADDLLSEVCVYVCVCVCVQFVCMCVGGWMGVLLWGSALGFVCEREREE